jgi:hypothetical protein
MYNSAHNEYLFNRIFVLATKFNKTYILPDLVSFTTPELEWLLNHLMLDVDDGI